MLVPGPETVQVDDVVIRAEEGEYVVPVDVVEKLGPDFFEELINEVRGSEATSPTAESPTQTIKEQAA